MIVTCVCQGQQESWGEKARKAFSDRCRPPWDDNIEVGREYPVYGVFFWGGFPWYLICYEPDDTCPAPKFALLFEQTDPTIPNTWILVPHNLNAGGAALLHPTWAKDDAFYEKLVDGDPTCAGVFRLMKVARARKR